MSLAIYLQLLQTIGFLPFEAGDGSLLRGNEIGEEHDEDTDDKADVEVDNRHPTLGALPGPLLAAACCSYVTDPPS